MSGSEDEADFASADEGEPEAQSGQPDEKGNFMEHLYKTYILSTAVCTKHRSLVKRKSICVVSDQVLHKQGCTATEEVRENSVFVVMSLSKLCLLSLKKEFYFI